MLNDVLTLPKMCQRQLLRWKDAILGRNMSKTSEDGFCLFTTGEQVICLGQTGATEHRTVVTDSIRGTLGGEKSDPCGFSEAA